MRITVKVRPNAKRESVVRENEVCFLVAVSVPAKGGKANWAVVRALAAYFDIAPSRIALVSGATVREKVFDID